MRQISLQRTAALAAAVVLSMATPALAQTPPPDNNNVKREPFRMIGNIYWVGHSQVGSFLITTPQGHILMDSTNAQEWSWVRDNVEKLGFKLTDVKILLNSHTHEEHMGGTAKLKELTGARLMVSEASASEMAVGGRTDFREDGRQLYTPVKTDRIVRNGDTVELGGVKLTAYLTPGHSKGATTWTMQVEEDGKKYNAVFLSGMSPAGIERAPILNSPKYPNQKADFELAYQRLKSLPCDVFLYARAPTIKLDEKKARLDRGEKPNPFIDPAGCKAYIAEYEKRFHDQLKEELAKQKK